MGWRGGLARSGLFANGGLEPAALQARPYPLAVGATDSRGCCDPRLASCIGEHAKSCAQRVGARAPHRPEMPRRSP